MFHLRKQYRILLVLTLVLAALFTTTSSVLASTTSTVRPQCPAAILAVPATKGKIALVVPSTPICGAPTSWTLNTSIADQISEPPGDGVDVAGKSYSDHYFWNLCGPGAATVALSYWKDVMHNGRKTFSDPHTSTTWDDQKGRSYMMYLATTVFVPGWKSAGALSYPAGTSYPYAVTYLDDMPAMLNWEASNHASNWQNYFYYTVYAKDLSAATLNAHVVSDIYTAGWPPVVLLDAYYLPDWAGHYHASHYVTIIGYNNSTGTYTYVETCGASCGTTGTGHYTISQSALYTAIQNNSANNGSVGALYW